MEVLARLSLLCVSLIVLCLVLTGQSSAEIDQESIVGVWLFDEGEGKVAKDSSKNGNDGELEGKPRWVDGKFGKALDFPKGSNNLVSIPDDDSLDLEDWTVAAWVKLENTGSWAAIVIKEEIPNVRNYGLWLQEAAQVLGAHVRADANDYQWSYGVTPISDSEWHHVAGTYDGNSIRAYVDGVLENIVSYPNKTPINTGPLRIGAPSNDMWDVQGIIDEVGIFNVALDLDDIKTIMNEGLGPLAAVEPSGKFATTWAKIRAQ